MSVPDIVIDGDACLTLAFNALIDRDVNARCLAIASEVVRAAIAGVRDVVPTFHTVSVYFDPAQLARAELSATLRALASAAEAVAQPDVGEPIEIPVKYGGGEGPDLLDVARFAQCDEADAVRMHTNVVYRVFMLGFLPGFAYLGTVDPRIAMPRLDTPRPKVVAGSIGIAAGQTAIYPVDSPGGWRIIGRSMVRTYDPRRADPFLLRPGQRVRFVAV